MRGRRICGFFSFGGSVCFERGGGGAGRVRARARRPKRGDNQRPRVPERSPDRPAVDARAEAVQKGPHRVPAAAHGGPRRERKAGDRSNRERSRRWGRGRSWGRDDQQGSKGSSAAAHAGGVFARGCANWDAAPARRERARRGACRQQGLATGAMEDVETGEASPAALCGFSGVVVVVGESLGRKGYVCAMRDRERLWR